MNKLSKSDADSVHAEASRRLEDDGWRVSMTLTGDSFTLELENDLTSGHGIVFREDDQLAPLEWLDEALSDREFEVIASRPKDPGHPGLLRALRIAAQVNGWSCRVLDEVATVLVSQSFLTDEEADWLELAGPAWSVSADAS
jgi:hypothetical protein